MFDKLKKAFGGSSEPEAPKVEEKACRNQSCFLKTTYWLHTLKWLYW